MTIVKGFLPVIGFTFLFWLAGAAEYVRANPSSPPDSLSDDVLGDTHAQGMNVEGNLSTSCSTIASSICLGTYEWNDNRQFDTSDPKGPFVSRLTYRRFFKNATFV